MTKDEALRLALEALEMYELETNSEFQRKAITAIKAALEAKDEPMACIEYIPCCLDKTCPKCKAITPPQRTWVGLTDDEIVLIVAECAASHQHTDIHFAKAIEAKLKEKNT